MKLIIGLGNPGEKYKNNRHNVGHMFVDQTGQGIKTDCFMNESGAFVSQKFNFYKIPIEDLYIVHDDLDISLGQYKIQKGTGPKVHNGINNIEEVLKSADFWRIRIGVDNRDPNNRTPGDIYVLQDFTKEEKEILKKVFEEILCKI